MCDTAYFYQLKFSVQIIWIFCDIKRYSLKDAFIIERASQFNLAEVIATTSDMPYMAYKLQKRMRMDPR